MKAEGVKRGIPDVFLPYPVYEQCPADSQIMMIRKAGLYIELKKLGKHAVSAEQVEFAEYCATVGYAYKLAIGWREAADAIQSYLS